MNLAVKSVEIVEISGNRGEQQAISISTQVSTEFVLFQQEFPIEQCDVKKHLIGQSGVGEKNPTPTPIVVTNPTPPP